jgi:predicted Zn-dependent protease
VVGDSLTKSQKQTTAALLTLTLALSGCVSGGYSGQRTSRETARPPSYHRVDQWEAQRLRRVVTPLLAVMDNPCRPNEIRIQVVNHAEINAANAGSCQFYVTTGLLRRATDDQLRGVMAHEIAHQDLAHVARAQAVGAGINIGVAVLEQLIPGSAPVSSVAGTLIARSYSRSEEFAADRHGMEILRRAGYPPAIMIDTLSWIKRVSGDSGGGFLSTHPALDDRIVALQKTR